jgi:ribosomal protein S18 acetylase RimI-like enzyme
LRVKEIQLTCDDDVNSFINYPFSLYRESSLWLPPLISSIKTSMNPKVHPFYYHSKAAFFIAEKFYGGEVLGRLAVLNNINYNEYRRSKAAFFCFFECLDNKDAAEALFTAAIDWAKCQGLEEIIGPRGISTGDGGGILVEGFDQPPVMGGSYNYDYYDRLLNAVGFHKNTDYYSGYLGRDNTLSVRYRRVANELAKRRGFKLKEFTRFNDLNQWVERIMEAHGEAFADNHTYFPPTDEEIKHLQKMLKTIVDPRLVKIVLKEEKIVGFLVALPDLADALKKCEGRLWPWGWHHLYLEKRRTKRIIVNLLAVHPAYRGRGIVAMLYSALAESFYQHGYEWLELVTVEESNRKALAEYDKLGACWYKRHRDYRMAI